MSMAASKEVEEFRNATMPGETQEAALLRKVKMHEFLMTGGVSLGYKDGRMEYGPPITVATDPVCPWHGEHCPAWEEIVAGRGHWTRMEAELEALVSDLELGDQADEVFDRVEKLREALELRPRDAQALRSRTPEQLAEDKAKADAKKLARKANASKTKWDPKAATLPKKKTGGNPWDRGPSEDRDHFKPMIFEPEEDSRNDAVAAFAGEDVPDVIEIDGDEGEEGDE